MNRLLPVIGAAMLAPLMLSADSYQFIISGDPVAAAAVGSSSAASSGKALVTDALATASASRPLEARFRTWLASLGKALRSDDWFFGTRIFLR